MSSLRLALKQSLAESGRSGSGSSADRKGRQKKRGPGRPRKHHRPRQPGDPPRKRGRPRKHPSVSAGSDGGEGHDRLTREEEEEQQQQQHPGSDEEEEDEDDGGHFSSENEFSVAEDGSEAEEDEEHDNNHEHDHEHEDSHNEQKEERDRADDCDDREHEHHNAASTIQSHWKGKRDKDTPMSEGEAASHQQQPSPEREEAHTAQSVQCRPPSSSLSPNANTHAAVTATATATADTSGGTSDKSSREAGVTTSPATSSVARDNKKATEESGGTAAPTTKNTSTTSTTATATATTSKSKTVPPPQAGVLEWMRNLPTKRARRNVAPGLRVKVRFATKVKREGKIVRKKKWFGGRVSAVSKEGSKIRIKYDDGTSEVTKFPDKDVVVDDRSNGQHQAQATRFIPPDHNPEAGSSAEGAAASAESQLPLVEPPADAKHSNRIERKHSSSPETTKPSQDADTVDEHLDGETGTAATTVVRSSKSGVSEEAPLTPRPEESSSSTAVKPKRKRGRPPKHRPSERSPAPTPKSPARVKDMVKEIGRELSAFRAGMEAARVTGESIMPQVPDLSVPLTEAAAARSKTDYRDRQSERKKSGDRPDACTGKHDKPNGDRALQRPSLTIRIPNVRKEDRAEAGSSRVSPFLPSSKVDDQDSRERDLSRQRKRSSDEPDEQGGSEAPALPTKRLHIHITTSKSSSYDSREKDSGVPVLVTDESKNGTTTGGEERPRKHRKNVEGVPEDAAAEESKRRTTESPILSRRVKPGESAIPASPASPRGKKQRRKRTGSEESSATPLLVSDVRSELTLSLPKLTKPPVKEGDTTGPPGTPMDLADDADPMTEGNSLIISSRNSAFETKDGGGGLGGAAADGGVQTGNNKPLTPRPRSKPDSSGSASAVRSGRRAAQQANERIVSRQQQEMEAAAAAGAVVVQETTQNKKKKRKRDRRKDGEGGGGEDSESSDDDSQWVQCDRCGKWRVIPSSVVSSLPKQWYCANNVHDPKRASCDAPEQTAKQAAKERKKKMKKRQQRLVMEAAAAAEGREGGVAARSDPSTREQRPAMTAPNCARSPAVALSPRPHSPPAGGCPREEFGNNSNPSSSSVNASPNSTDSGSDSSQKGEKRTPAGTTSSVSKKGGRSQEPSSSSSASTLTEEQRHVEAKPPSEAKRRPGRPRRNPLPVPKESEECPVGGAGEGIGTGTGSGTVAQTPTEEVDNLEWVQCEKCDKWRKLPPHISADELPEVWYCTMNTWNPAAANCEVPEDKVDGLQDIGFGGSGSMGAGKLSYRSLIFGNTGRKQNRPVSERTRAAESLFAAPSDDAEAPPTVMYANSSAFTSSRSSKSNNNDGTDENEGMSVFELMSHSRLWQELRGNATAVQPLNANSTNNSMAASFLGAGLVRAGAGGGPETYPHPRAPFFTFDTIPVHLRPSMKDLILHSLGTRTMTGDEILLEAQCRNWDNAPKGWAAVRAYCSLNVVVTALCELVKEGVVECVQKMGSGINCWDIRNWNPRYRRADALSSSAELANGTESSQPSSRWTEAVKNQTTTSSRCMKIAKPWKRAQVM